MTQSIIKVLRLLGCEGLGNFGIGSPRNLPPLLAVIRMMIAAMNPWGHGYAEPQGRIKTRKALAKNCRRTLGVQIDPSQVLLLEGSKPAIRYVLQALRLVGKVVLPMSYYPGNFDGVLAAGCTVEHIPMPSVKKFISNLRTALENGFRPVAVVLSFDNPRWLMRDLTHYQDLVDLARQYGFIILSDEAYRDLAYNGNPASIMQVEGWQEVAVCIQTASKPFCMAGWKLGALITNSKWTEKILVIKSKDSEGGSPVAQKGYAAALWCVWYPKRRAKMYYRRAQYTVSMLSHFGIKDITMPFGGMFVYFGIEGMSSVDFAARMKEYGFIVSVGERFGEPGKIRWCLNQGNWMTRRAAVAVAEVLGQNHSKAA